MKTIIFDIIFLRNIASVFSDFLIFLHGDVMGSCHPLFIRQQLPMQAPLKLHARLFFGMVTLFNMLQRPPMPLVIANGKKAELKFSFVLEGVLSGYVGADDLTPLKN
ncbi:hypothetical protein ACO0LM_18270 [Undibacterium sp. Di26W]|uniref:hypothetical protein n=1 Tax=Undibacterium sp. Di26W TaxID=3413035 RepID=UPI003BF16B3D